MVFQDRRFLVKSVLSTDLEVHRTKYETVATIRHWCRTAKPRMKADKTNRNSRESDDRPRHKAEQIVIKTCITLLVFASIAIAIVLIAMCFAPTFGRFWE